MPDTHIAIPPPPVRRRPTEIRIAVLVQTEARHGSELREACLVGAFALAVCWLAAELAVAFGLH